MAWQTPKTDWQDNPRPPKRSDFDRIEGNTEYVKDLAEVVEDADTTKKYKWGIDNGKPYLELIT